MAAFSRRALILPLLLGVLPACGEPEAAPTPAVSRMMNLGNASLEYVHGIQPADQGVLLLHGAAFSLSTWQELGTLNLLASEGVPYCALNLPGKGLSQTPPIPAEDLLIAVLDQLGWRRALVVSPSASGRYSLPLMARHPQRVRGLFAAAPVGIPTWLDALRGSGVPVLTFWSQDDGVVPIAHADQLALAVQSADQFSFAGSKHPIYLEQTETFHQALLEFWHKTAGD